MRRLFIAIFCAIAGAVLLAPASASANGWGPRVGVTMDPDQIHFGAHTYMGDISRRVRFQPNIEVGVGDDLTVAAVNFEALYRFAQNWDVWTPYLGGGVGLNWYNWDGGRFPGRDDSDMRAGLNVVGGIEKGLRGGDRFLLELKLGLSDSPDMKVTAGWTFF